MDGPVDLSKQKLVAHLKGGEVVKGYSRDFAPGSSHFHLLSLGEPIASSRRISVDELKAAFLVKSWGRSEGHVVRRYAFGVGGMKGEPGRRALVRFQDGERIWGYALDQDAPDGGFWLVPADPDDNNLRVFVVRSSLSALEFLDQRETAH